MVYLLSVTLKSKKKVFFELTSLYGIGKYQSHLLCHNLSIGTDCYIGELTQAQIYRLLKQIEQSGLIVESALQRQKRSSLSNLVEKKCYRGVRHIFNLPVRGQRTRTNAKSCKHTKIKGI